MEDLTIITRNVMQGGRWIMASLLFLVCTSCGVNLPDEVESAYEELPEKVDFNYHVKPILSDKCYHCHGPDANTRRANLRLDTAGGAFLKLGSGGVALVRGHAGQSVALKRILSADSAFRMPPPGSNLNLTSREMATLVKWVEQGAEWKPHWSFVSPSKSAIPADVPKTWTPYNEIDKFV